MVNEAKIAGTVPGDFHKRATQFDRHSRIVHNLHGILSSRLSGQPYQARAGGIALAADRSAAFRCPDAFILIAPPQFDFKPNGETAILNPSVIFEVMTDATEAEDRGDKFYRYWEIESFSEYVLICNDRPSVDVYVRQPTNRWLMYFYNGLDAEPQLETVPTRLPLVELYGSITFPKRPAESPETEL